MTKLKNIIQLFVAFAVPQIAICCTIFTWSSPTKVLAAGNEDWSDPFTKVWFHPSTKSKYGSICFGFSDRQIQAAMNEHGLFYDYAAIPTIKLKASKKEIFKEDLLFEIISKCKTVAEAIPYLQRYQFDITGAQALLADSKGNAVIITADTVLFKTKNYFITTNFNICAPAEGGYPCLRYSMVDSVLSRSSNVSRETCKELLNLTHQEGEISTQYSNIYDLKEGKVYVYNFHNFTTAHVFDLKNELKKGQKEYNLTDFFPAKTFAEISFRDMHKIPIADSILYALDNQGLEAAIKKYYLLKTSGFGMYDFGRQQLNTVGTTLIKRVWEEKYPGKAIDWELLWTAKDDRLRYALEVFKLNAKEVPHYRTFDSLGYGYMLVGDKQKAIENYQKSLELFPESGQGKRMLEQLKNTGNY